MVIVIVIFCLLLYFIPTIVAADAKKRNAGAIFALNLFLGWTLVGWVVSLVWALTKDPAMDRGNSASQIVPSATISSKNDHLKELEHLASLKEKGVITEEDFEAKKKQLLGI